MAEKDVVGGRHHNSHDRTYEQEPPVVVGKFDAEALQEVAEAVSSNRHYLEGGHQIPINSTNRKQGMRPNGFWLSLLELSSRRDIDTEAAHPVGEGIRRVLHEVLVTLGEKENIHPGIRYLCVEGHFRYPGGYDLPADNTVFHNWQINGDKVLRASTGEQPRYALPKRSEFLDGNLVEKLNRDDPHAPVKIWQPNEGEIIRAGFYHLISNPLPEAILSMPYLEAYVYVRNVS